MKPIPVPSLWGSLFHEPSYGRNGLTEAARLKKQTACKQKSYPLISSGNKVQERVLHTGMSSEQFQIHLKMAATLYKAISLTLLFHFHSANSSEAKSVNLQALHQVRIQTPSHRNYSKTLLHSEVTQQQCFLRLCKGRLKSRRCSI